MENPNLEQNTASDARHTRTKPVVKEILQAILDDFDKLPMGTEVTMEKGQEVADAYADFYVEKLVPIFMKHKVVCSDTRYIFQVTQQILQLASQRVETTMDMLLERVNLHHWGIEKDEELTFNLLDKELKKIYKESKFKGMLSKAKDILQKLWKTKK